MIGTKYLSDVLDVSQFQRGKINLIEAPCGCGKTTCAKGKIADLASSRNKVLYLIDTTNGCNVLANCENTNKLLAWDIGEGQFYNTITPIPYEEIYPSFNQKPTNDMWVSTYANFGLLIREYGPALLNHFEIIIADEAHNMLQFATYSPQPNSASEARDAVRDDALKELRLSHNREEKRRPLTLPEQTLFLNYLKNTEKYQHWYPVFAVMLGTGLRVGEVVGLRWQDIDLDEGTIDINHTLIYYRHAVNGCYCNIHLPKTFSSIRKIPMLDFVKEAFLQEKQYQQENGICCKAIVNGYTDFIFVNRFGDAQHQGTLNKALRRIVRDCNDEVLRKGHKDSVLLPYFSCHILRHTFTTRMCEAGLNVKVIQDALGHSDVRTTLNIYAEATKDLKKKEFANLEVYWNDQRVLKPL